MQCTRLSAAGECMAVSASYVHLDHSLVATLFLGVLNECYKAEQHTVDSGVYDAQYWQQEPIFTTPTQGLLLGLGSGLLGTILFHRFPSFSLEAVDPNPFIANEVPFYLGFPRNSSRATVVMSDGGLYLASRAVRQVKYDFILADMCDANDKSCHTPGSADSECCPPATMLSSNFYTVVKHVLQRKSDAGRSGMLLVHQPKSQDLITTHHLEHHFRNVRKLGGKYEDGQWTSFVYLAWDGPDLSLDRILELNDRLQFVTGSDQQRRRRLALLQAPWL